MTSVEERDQEIEREVGSDFHRVRLLGILAGTPWLGYRPRDLLPVARLEVQTAGGTHNVVALGDSAYWCRDILQDGMAVRVVGRLRRAKTGTVVIADKVEVI